VPANQVVRYAFGVPTSVVSFHELIPPALPATGTWKVRSM